MSNPSDVIVSDNFTLEGRAVEVFLTPTVIFWEQKSQLVDGYGVVGDSLYRQDHQSISLTDVVGVAPLEPDSTDAAVDKSCNCAETLQLTDLSAAGGGVGGCLAISYVKRSSGHRWKTKRIVFHPAGGDSGVCERWIHCIRERLAEPQFNRPRHLLVFINPLSGNRAGPSVYAQRIQPLFDLAGIRTRVIVTERANHARDTLLEDDLAPYSGVVCVGGDGMFSELVHGMLLRARQDEGLADAHGPDSPEVRPQVRIGIIPAGSTDTVVFSTGGCNDPVTSALHIIVGDCMGLDVMAVHSDQRFLRYNVSLLGYGFYGDIIADSEPLRWMGPARYDWLGFKKFCRHRLYHGEISFLASPDRSSHPRDGVTCLAGCSVCSDAREGEGADSDGDGDGTKWQSVRGAFVAVNSFLMSCRCKKAMDGASPSAHLGNGFSDLMIVGDCSRLDYMKHLLRFTDRRADQFDFSFIQVHRVKEFQFTPGCEPAPAGGEPATGEDVVEAVQDDVGHSRQFLGPKAKQKTETRTNVSCWNCDGEPLEQPSIRGRVHRQLILIFSRGIEEEEGERRCPTECVSRNCLGCARAKRM